MKSIRIGTDPEFIILDSNGDLASAIDFLPGTKDAPYPLGLDCFVQVDNVMAEFCVPPATNHKELISSLEFAKAEAIKFLPKGYSFVARASDIYPQELLSNPIAQTFGCEPDFSPYNHHQKNILEYNNQHIFIEADPTINEKPACDEPRLRSCGGHIHLDLTEFLFDFKMRNNFTVFLCDLFLGIPSILEDNDTQRKLLYGKAGAFRPKSYGIEYRVLSNYWLGSDVYTENIFNRVKRISEELNSVYEQGSGSEDNFSPRATSTFSSAIVDCINRYQKVTNYSVTEIINIINNNEIKKAKEICDKLEIPNTNISNHKQLM